MKPQRKRNDGLYSVGSFVSDVIQLEAQFHWPSTRRRDGLTLTTAVYGQRFTATFLA